MIESTESFLKIEAIFNEIMSIEPSGAQTAKEVHDSRVRRIAELSRGDTGLIDEVESLLRACEEEELASTTLRTGSQAAKSDALPRKRLGPYELDRLLGRGGMGAVYLAHRADGQFEQQVAIKLIDLPLATDLFRERFRQERQILAGLQHPFIARLLDGGVSAEGDLYLAMEFVDGVPIHRYCADNKLSINQRLLLFKSVCQAVQFAHQNFVVHRDLKPDNILVAEDGTPRLLDFGTAKLLSPSLEKEEGDLTRQGFSSYTPQYASPEQVLGNPITTASDTYSLGVLLYLLLTETMPYKLKELTTAELVRVIVEEPPRKPTVIAGANRRKERRLDPDLEAILLKAIRKEPQQRYLTAEQFETDIEDFLEARPVAARRGTFRYRAAKFIRRNRLALAAAGILALTLVAGVAGVLWQAKVANQERRRADARAADLRQLSNSLLSELDEAIKQLPGSTGVQKMLVTQVLGHLDRMAADGHGDRVTQLDLIDAYSRLADLQGDPYDQNLGDPTGALTSVGKALALAEPLAISDPNDRHTLQSLATAQVTRSEILFGTGKTADAVASMQAAVRNYDRLIAPADAPVALIGEVAAVYGTLGDELGQTGTASLGDPAAAMVAYRKTIDLDHRALKIDPNFFRAKRGLAIMQLKIGSVELESDPVQALKDFKLAIQLVDSFPESEKSNLSVIRLHSMLLRKEANAMIETCNYADAAPIFEEVAQIYRKMSAQDPEDLRALADFEVILDDQAIAFENAAIPALAPPSRNPEQDRRQNLLAAEDRYRQVESTFEQMIKRSPSNENWKAELATAQVKVGTIASQLHNLPEAVVLSKKGTGTLKEMTLKGAVSPMILDHAVESFLTVEPANLRDPDFALACAEKGVALSHRQNAPWLHSLAQAYRGAGQLDKARATAREGLALLPPYRSGDPKSRIRRLLEWELKP